MTSPPPKRKKIHAPPLRRVDARAERDKIRRRMMLAMEIKRRSKQ